MNVPLEALDHVTILLKPVYGEVTLEPEIAVVPIPVIKYARQVSRSSGAASGDR